MYLIKGRTIVMLQGTKLIVDVATLVVNDSLAWSFSWAGSLPSCGGDLQGSA